MTALQILPVFVDGEIAIDARLGPLLLESAQVEDGDIIAVSSKAVAKAEGSVVDVDNTPEAWEALVLSQSRRVLRRRGDLLITETHHGFVCANAGIDRSNIERGRAVLLPRDSDRSAHVLRNELRGIGNVDTGVIVMDTMGRAWREGLCEQALGCAGLRPIDDLRGTEDSFGNQLALTQICVVDQLAAAAALVMGKSDGTPFAIIRGVSSRHFGEGSISADVIRSHRNDLFR